MSEELTRIHQQSFADASAATRSAYPPEGRLSGEQLARFLDAHRYGVAATTRQDGRPHAAPTLYVRTGATFWLPTMTGTYEPVTSKGSPGSLWSSARARARST